MGLFSDILLTVDYDRTLTAPDSTIPARNFEAIHYFIDNGGTFTVNTGRSVPMAQAHIIGKVPVNAPLLLYNGSAAYDVQTREFSQCFIIPVDPEEMVADLLEKFPHMYLELQGQQTHALFRPDAGWERYCQHNQCPWSYADPKAVPRPFLKLALTGEYRDKTVASMYDATEEELRQFEEATAYLMERYGDRIEAFRACARILDLHAKGVSKLNAARTLQKRLGKKILVCVGDGENDATMLDGADYAYCPSDAVVAARYENVCPCGEGAVADVIYKKIPEILASMP